MNDQTQGSPEPSHRQQQPPATIATSPITTPDHNEVTSPAEAAQEVQGALQHQFLSVREDNALMRRLQKMGGSNAQLVGRLRSHHVNIFNNTSNVTSNVTRNSNNNNNNNEDENAQISDEQQKQQQAELQQPLAVQVGGRHGNNNEDCITVSRNVIPSAHIRVITQAFGNKACLYKDILQIPSDMTSDRDIRIAYFRRGRQVLAERPCDSSTNTTAAATSTSAGSSSCCANENNGDSAIVNGKNVSQIAKLKFQAVSMAYEILSNPVWKESYDRYGLEGAGASREPPGDVVVHNDDASLAEQNVNHDDYGEQQDENIDSNKTNSLSPADKLYNLRMGLSNNTNGGNFQSKSVAKTVTRSSLPPQPVPLQPTVFTSSWQSRPACTPTTSNKKKKRVVIQAAAGLRLPSNQNKKDGDNMSYVSQSTAGTGTSRSSVLRKPGSFLEKLARTKANLRRRGETGSGEDKQGVDNSVSASGNTFMAEAPTSSTVRWNEEVEELIFRQDPEETSYKVRTPEQDMDYGVTALATRNSVDRNESENGQSQVDYEKEAYHGSLESGDLHHKPKGGGKVVLDTTELGSHLEKLDKVADSIADIFDELEASFDGLLGGGLIAQGQKYGKGSKQKNQNQQHATRSTSNGMNVLSTPFPDYTSDSRPANASEGLSFQHAQQASPTPLPVDAEWSHFTGSPLQSPVDRVLTEQESDQVEEQAMALLREVTAMGAVPPTDILVKNKNTPQQLHRQNTPPPSEVLSEAAVLVGRQHTTGVDPHEELRSFCESEAAGETNTVATSVVSLLDAQQHTNAPLKPAAATSTTLRASRRRLKKVQQRRQQQRANEEQHSSEEMMRVINRGIEEEEEGNYYVNIGKRKKGDKKKHTDDLYFESLYQNFFAVPKERLPNEMTVRVKPTRSSCSVSTISHSVATTQDPPMKLDFNPWELVDSAWPTLGDDQGEAAQKRRHTSNVMARVNEMERSLSKTVDSSFTDESGLDSTFDSGTAVDTTIDEGTVDSAFTSTLGNMDNMACVAPSATALTCQSAPEKFLNQVFDVPLEAPLEFWCGEMRDAPSSVAPQKKRALSDRQHPKRKTPAKADKPEKVSLENLSDGILEDEGADTPADDSSVLLDPPTHDSRIFRSSDTRSFCDEMTLNTLNTSNPDTSNCSRPESGTEDSKTSSVSPASNSYQSTAAVSDRAFEEQASQPTDPNGKANISQDVVTVETASVSQFARDFSTELAYSVSTAGQEDLAEEREDVSPFFSPLSDTGSGSSNASAADINRTNSVSPSTSSFSLRRSESENSARPLIHGQEQNFEKKRSSETSVSSTISKAKDTSSFVAYLEAYLKDLNLDFSLKNATLASVKAHLSHGLESWNATHESCMDSIVVPDGDMDSMLEILHEEVIRSMENLMPGKKSGCGAS